jgi:hypothetical protein
MVVDIMFGIVRKLKFLYQNIGRMVKRQLMMTVWWLILGWPFNRLSILIITIFENSGMERWTPEADGDGEMKGLVVLSCERRGLSMHVLSWRRIRPGGLSPRFADLTVYSVSV